MEYCRYSPASPETQEKIIKEHQQKLQEPAAKGKKKKNQLNKKNFTIAYDFFVYCSRKKIVIYM